MIFDLLMLNSAASGVLTTPADLFKPGDKGAWYDSSDLTTMFEDDAGTIPVTGLGQPVGKWNNKIAGQTADFDLKVNPAWPYQRGDLILGAKGPVLQFNGNNSGLAGVNTSINAASITMAIGQKSTTAATKRAFDLSLFGTAQFIQNLSDQTVRAQVLNIQVDSTGTTSLTTPNILVSYGSSSIGGLSISAAIRVNGVETVGAIPAAIISSVQSEVPSEDANTCQISQAFFIDRVLTPDEITFLESYIASKQ